MGFRNNGDRTFCLNKCGALTNNKTGKCKPCRGEKKPCVYCGTVHISEAQVPRCKSCRAKYEVRRTG